jgi:hypothetical protein
MNIAVFWDVVRVVWYIMTHVSDVLIASIIRAINAISQKTAIFMSVVENGGKVE